MKLITTPLLAIVTAAVVIGMVTVGIQQVYAPRQCAGCVQFKKLTHEFEKNVIKTIKDTNTGPQPHLRELLQAYSQNVQRIFIGDPNIDEVRTLLQSYEQDVTRIFDQSPPEPDKQLIKEFKGITKDFVKAVIGAITPPPEPDTPA
jgi:hypothetical protein